MSGTNDINFKGTGNDIDDAEGHAFRGHGGLDDGSGTDEAEGHGWKGPEALDDTDTDTEGHGTPGKRTEQQRITKMPNLRNYTRRSLAGLTAAVALSAFGIAAGAGEASATDWTTPNTGQSSTGAFLQSAGICGYGEFNFTIDNRGFEQIQIGLVTSVGTIWSDPEPAANDGATTTPVPALSGWGYYVVGWDWTSNGWETVTVLTSFWYPDTGQNLNGC